MATVVVTVPETTLCLSGTLLFRLNESHWFQILIEMDDQEVVTVNTEDRILVRGDYDDMIERRIEPLQLSDVSLPDTITSVIEFQTLYGKVVGAEICLSHGSFSVTTYPEDVEVRPAGGAWDFVREYGLPQLHDLIVRQITDSDTG